jgi:hypothetical protein
MEITLPRIGQLPLSHLKKHLLPTTRRESAQKRKVRLFRKCDESRRSERRAALRRLDIASVSTQLRGKQHRFGKNAQPSDAAEIAAA